MPVRSSRGILSINKIRHKACGDQYFKNSQNSSVAALHISHGKKEHHICGSVFKSFFHGRHRIKQELAVQNRQPDSQQEHNQNAYFNRQKSFVQKFP